MRVSGWRRPGSLLPRLLPSYHTRHLLPSVLPSPCQSASSRHISSLCPLSTHSLCPWCALSRHSLRHFCQQARKGTEKVEQAVEGQKKAAETPESVDIEKLLEKWNTPEFALPPDHGVVTFDRKGLFKAPFREVTPGSKSPSSPFIEALKMHIGVRGPVSVNDWMRLCLGHPQFGYYITAEPFGRAGDFVTAPEISPIFGELLAVWCVRTWQKMGNPKSFRLMECGPGSGVMMKHLLRTSRKFPEFRNAIKSVHFVETSPRLRAIQQKTLSVQLDEKGSGEAGPAKDMFGYTEGDRVQVRWHWHVQDLPRNEPVIIIANEFFDALPVHQFLFTERGWQEKMVDLDVSDSPTHFRYVLIQTPACVSVIPPALFPSPPATHPKQFERSLVGMSVIQEMGKIIRATGGAALVIDYGFDHPSGDTVRAISEHTFVDVLENPGKSDMSANVDFSSLRDAIQTMKTSPENNRKLFVHPTITQRLLLRELGFAQRLNQMVNQVKASKDFTEEEEKKAEAICDAAIRLVDDETPRSMGVLFKALCVSDDSLSGTNTPDGFDPKLRDDRMVHVAPEVLGTS